MWGKIFSVLRSMINWKMIASFLITQLKGEAFKKICEVILGSALAGGIRGWLLKLAFDKGWKELEEHVIEPLLNETQYTYERIDGKYKIKKLEEAKNENEHNTTIGDILS